MNLMPHSGEYQHRWNNEDNEPGGRPLLDKVHGLYCSFSYGSLRGTNFREVWVAMRSQIPSNPYSDRLDELLRWGDPEGHPEHLAADREIDTAISYIYAWLAGRASTP